MRRANTGTGRLAARAASNILLGAALGLVAYVGVTNAANALEQRALRADLRGPGPAGVRSADSLPRLDFTGWQHDEAFWRGLPDGAPFGRLVIARIGLDTVVVRGTSPQDLRRGPGWIEQTSLPGPEGNVGISGHRTTYGHPFGRLGELSEGDTIDLYSPYRRYRYEVVRSLVVAPDDVEVVAFTKRPTLTLTACHPPYSARQRLIVQSRLIDVRVLDEGGGG